MLRNLDEAKNILERNSPQVVAKNAVKSDSFAVGVTTAEISIFS